MKIWCHFYCRESTLSASTVIDAFADENISISQFDPDKESGPGVLFFEEVNQQITDFLREASRHCFERILAIAVIDTALNNINIWRLLQAGAADVFGWNQCINPAAEIAERVKRWDEVDQLVNSPLVRDNLVGQSHVWKSVLRQVVEVACFTDASVLITGESGTGKELVARLIHTLDRRENKRDLIILDCTTIMPELSGSEFFGHERGAFTGALTVRKGAFELANNGTLFLDEVGDLPLNLQSQLLRVVQEGTYKHLGSNSWEQTNFRLVCATNKDLSEMVKQGKFRHDLYYRIAGWMFNLPPLRERSEDILLLTRHFIEEDVSPKNAPPYLDESVRNYLLNREYPGNVRDLKQLVSRILHRYVGSGHITVGFIPEEEYQTAKFGSADWRDEYFERSIRLAISQGFGLKEIGRAAEDAAVRIAVREEKGNLQRAAGKLGVTDRALQMRRAARRQHEQAPLAQKS